MDLWKNRNFKPFLLKEFDEPFNSKDYIFEVKFDGIRALCFVSPDSISLINRNGNEMLGLFPELNELKSLVKTNVIFDGEIVSFVRGVPSFSHLQERNHLKDKMKIKEFSENDPVVFVAFDIIYENEDLTSKTLTKRKKYLNKYDDNDYFIKSKVINSEGVKLFESIKKMNLEGIVAKKKSSKYHINERSDDWVKIKNYKEGTFVIGGYTINKNGISLLLGELQGSVLYYVGSVNLPRKDELYNNVIKCNKRKKSPFKDYSADHVIYISPKLSTHVKYLEKTKNNHLRQPVLKSK